MPLGILGQTASSTLDRFVRELEDQSPEPIEALGPDLSESTAEERDHALFTWSVRIVDEHRSAVRFTEVLRWLLELDAPYPMLAAMQRLIGDELRHARLCARLAAGFGPIDRLRIDLGGLGWPVSKGQSAAENALEVIVRELVIGEGESLACLKAYRRATTDRACQTVLDVLITDEARHYAAGKHLEAAMLEHAPALAAFHEALEDRLLADVKAIRAAHRAGAGARLGRRYGAAIDLSEAPPPIE